MNSRWGLKRGLRRGLLSGLISPAPACAGCSPGACRPLKPWTSLPHSGPVSPCHCKDKIMSGKMAQAGGQK